MPTLTPGVVPVLGVAPGAPGTLIGGSEFAAPPAAPDAAVGVVEATGVVVCALLVFDVSIESGAQAVQVTMTASHVVYACLIS